MEQTVDIPAPRSRGLRGGLQGFFPGQSSTAAAVDIPVPRGDLQGFLPGQGSTASSSHSPDAADEAGQGVFALFPVGKSATVPPHSGSELPPHSSSWTSAAYAKRACVLLDARLLQPCSPAHPNCEVTPAGSVLSLSLLSKWQFPPSLQRVPYGWLAVLILLFGGHQLLQNANDLAALWCVPLTGIARQERKQSGTIIIGNPVRRAFEPTATSTESNTSGYLTKGVMVVFSPL